MASIRKEVSISARPEEVWEALRAWDALHERLVPGFVVDTRLDDRTHFVWVADLLLNHRAPATSELMQRGTRVIK